MKHKQKKCPDCGKDWKKDIPSPACICNKPLMLYVPPGEHVHLNCPVHGDFVVSGGPIITC